MPKPTLYLSGPMTGLPDFNAAAFTDAQRRLEGAGFTVASPSQPGDDPATTSWHDFLLRDLSMLARCDAVALLPGWQDSPGACAEVDDADDRWMVVRDLDLWLAGNDWTAAHTADGNLSVERGRAVLRFAHTSVWAPLVGTRARLVHASQPDRALDLAARFLRLHHHDLLERRRMLGLFDQAVAAALAA